MSSDQRLQEFPFFREVSSERLIEIAAAGHPLQLSAGQFAFEAGAGCQAVPLVYEGTIRVFHTGVSGREITLYHVHPGETCLLSLNGAITGATYSAWALAETDVTGMALPAPSFRHWVDVDGTVRRHTFALMTQRLTDLMQLIDEVVFHRLDRRIAHLLLDRSGATAPALSITHEQIAAHLGSAREVVSRVLRDLERHGMIKRERGRIELLDPRALRRLAEHG